MCRRQAWQNQPRYIYAQSEAVYETRWGAASRRPACQIARTVLARLNILLWLVCETRGHPSAKQKLQKKKKSDTEFYTRQQTLEGSRVALNAWHNTTHRRGKTPDRPASSFMSRNSATIRAALQVRAAHRGTGQLISQDFVAPDRSVLSLGEHRCTPPPLMLLCLQAIASSAAAT